jgi:LysM repeat protein
MKRFLILLFAVPLYSLAQEKLYVQGTSPNLYLNHVVAPKEGFYKIARNYNINPQKLAAYNAINYEKGPNVGATIKIPLTQDNFSQDDTISGDEVLVPLYHIIQEKDGLYRISTMYNKVPISQLEKWNNMQGEAISKGTPFIVGYLKVKKNVSVLAAPAPAPTEVTTIITPTQNEPVVVAPPTPVKKDSPILTPVVAAPVKKETPKAVAQPVTKKHDVKPVTKTETPVVTADVTTNEGAFKVNYLKQTDNGKTTKEQGSGAFFKSTSGWVETKYYCLQNNASPGTIIKVSNPDNGKIIYVKVLGPMPDISQNSDLVILVGNAAADALGADKNGKFNCTLEYSK